MQTKNKNGLGTAIAEAQINELLSQPWNIQGINTNGSELVISIKSNKRNYGYKPENPRENTKTIDNFRFSLPNAEQAKVYAETLRRWIKTTPWPRKKRANAIDCDVQMPKQFSFATHANTAYVAFAEGGKVTLTAVVKPKTVVLEKRQSTPQKEGNRAGLERHLSPRAFA